jgi:phosphohistidine phosphatase
MTELYILRHGIAVERGNPDIPDDQRPLTPKGRQRMRQIGRGLDRLGIEPDAIVSSPLPRAWETAEIVAEALKLSGRLEASEQLRDDRSAHQIRDWVLARGESRLMIVGHNPAFTSLVGLLATGQVGLYRGELKKGGLAAFSTLEEGGFALDWIATPQLLRRLDG